jgi:hypothetical protein
VSRLVELLEVPEARGALARQGMAWVGRYHDPAVVADRLVEMYEAILAGPRQG